MSVSAMRTLVNPYLSSTKTLPHDVATKLIESAKDQGVVSARESDALFAALRRDETKFETPADRALLAKTALTGVETADQFSALSFAERRRLANDIYDAAVSNPAGKVGTYTVSKAVTMPSKMKYTDALVKLGFPLKAAQNSASDIAQYRRNVDATAAVKCRLITNGGQVVATEVFMGSGSTSFRGRYGANGAQFLRYTPWVD